MGRRSRQPSPEEIGELVECREQEYEAKLHEKAVRLTGYISRAMGEEEAFECPQVYASSPSEFRQRVNFRVLVEKDEAHFVMFSQKTSGQPLRIDTFPRGDSLVNRWMPIVRSELNRLSALRRHVIECRFHTTLRGGGMILLCYNKPIGSEWKEAAEILHKKIVEASPKLETILILGRSHKLKLIVPESYEEAAVVETLHVDIDPPLHLKYKQVEGEFSQPNAKVCEKMLQWGIESTHFLGGQDLLELYCGNGNFSVALAQNFRKVLATEMSKHNIVVARHNVRANHLNNVKCVRLAADEVAEALTPGARSFTRLVEQQVQVTDYDFGAVLVDPPRAGIEDSALELLATFPHIIYFSCNPESLARDLHTLRKTHFLQQLAIFDQFPYTDHVECGLLLAKRDTPKTLFSPSALLPVMASSIKNKKSSGAKEKRKQPSSSSSPETKSQSRGASPAAAKRRRLFGPGCQIM